MNEFNELHELQKLMNQGFIIYQNFDKWTLKKITTPNDDRKMDESTFDYYDEAFGKAIALADKPVEKIWEVFIRLSKVRGSIGPESIKLENIMADSQEEAQRKADEMGLIKYRKRFLEARVRPKNKSPR